MKTLFLEEDHNLTKGIVQSLRERGQEVEWAASCEEFYARCGAHSYDMIILDSKLSDGNCVDIVKRLRKTRIDTPILVLSAKLDVEQKIRLFDAGADDHLTKPIDLRELEARMRVLHRRYNDLFSPKGEIGNVLLDPAARSVCVAGKSIPFSKREFRLFELLTARINSVVPKERLMDQLFGYDEDVGPNAVELYVSRVRQKIRDSSLRIETVRSVGYVARILEDNHEPVIQSDGSQS
jgi:two-component system, OmpR family, response regulator TctD